MIDKYSFIYFIFRFNQFGRLLHQGQLAKQFKYAGQWSLKPHLPQLLHLIPFDPLTGKPVIMHT